MGIMKMSPQTVALIVIPPKLSDKTGISLDDGNASILSGNMHNLSFSGVQPLLFANITVYRIRKFSSLHFVGEQFDE